MTKSKTACCGDAAEACAKVLDTLFFKALCEPARISLIQALVLKGRADVGTLANEVPQDRSVVARHLQLMQRAGLLISSTEGRNTFYEIDTRSILGRLEEITSLMKVIDTTK